MEQLIRDKLSAICVSTYQVEKSKSVTQNQPLKSPVGVLQLPDNSVLVCDTFNHRLVQFEENGNAKQVFNGTPPMVRPSAAVLLTAELCHGAQASKTMRSTVQSKPVFAVKDNFNIYVFDAACRQVDLIRKLSRPYGLTVDDNDMLVTVETGAGALPLITRVDLDTGDRTRVPFDLVPSEDRRRSSKPRFIAYHQDDVLVVVDLGLDLVAMVSMSDGSVLRCFGSYGSGPGEFRDPSGVVCDAEGFIIIGDSRNHRVQVFSNKGEFLCVLRIDRPLRRPSGLCLTASGHLLIINYWENTVAKYQLSVE
ncbi:NHL repeat [Trinorchestia longiramus]|nr:NHL repeat [Trinorchestia longiramus]